MCLGIPGQIVKITDVERQMALVDVSGVQREVSLECVVDDYHPLDKMRRPLGIGACWLRHEPDQRGGGRGHVEGPEGAWRSAGGTSRDEGIGVESTFKRFCNSLPELVAQT